MEMKWTELDKDIAKDKCWKFHMSIIIWLYTKHKGQVSKLHS